VDLLQTGVYISVSQVLYVECGVCGVCMVCLMWCVCLQCVCAQCVCVQCVCVCVCVCVCITPLIPTVISYEQAMLSLALADKRQTADRLTGGRRLIRGRSGE